MTRQDVIALVHSGFASTPRPANDDLRNSSQGDEPYLVEEEFADKADWRTLTPSFLDAAPDGFGSALSFFSAAAFRFFLPAYLIADLDDQLRSVTPTFHLWHGLDDETGPRPLNPNLYGERTWRQYVSERFSRFTKVELEAIVAYLRVKASEDSFSSGKINEALRNYWVPRLEAT